MSKNSRLFSLLAVLSLASLSILTSCGGPVPTGYRTYSLPDKGIAHLSFEYPAAFNVTEVQLLDSDGYERMDIDGPFSRLTRSRTTMWVVAQKYAESVSIGDLIASAESVAKGFDGYRLIDRSVKSINGITAEQYTYFYYSARSDYETRIVGLEPVPTVTRQLYFTYGGLQWTVAMSADESTVEADNISFERLLETLTMLP